MVPTGTGNQGKPGKMGRHFPVREFCQDWKSQGILPKILEKQENLNQKNVFCESQGILHKMFENQWIWENNCVKILFNPIFSDFSSFMAPFP